MKGLILVLTGFKADGTLYTIHRHYAGYIALLDYAGEKKSVHASSFPRIMELLKDTKFIPSLAVQ